MSMVVTEKTYLWTGQQTCHDMTGAEIDCAGSSQDAEFRSGIPWPSPRFLINDELVEDCLTGLLWTKKSNFAEFPLTWQEALDFVANMNRGTCLDFADWRLPNRRELHSLLSFQNSKPALPEGHPFEDVFLGWYWSSTSAAISPDHAWYVHMEGGRIFYGGKDQSYLVWPVRGTGKGVLPVTGQQDCYDDKGVCIECAGSGQDGEYRMGRVWPQPRFNTDDVIEDCLTGLCWARQASLTNTPVTWRDALMFVSELNLNSSDRHWRLPTINELESLVDCSRANPALAVDELFKDIKDVYWSSTTSLYEPDWAMALYVDKGAVGVGQKWLPHFYVWPVFTKD
ncbi:MAG: DUF1566 domain-containing protein [Gammaproteobacteria bacterium]